MNFAVLLSVLFIAFSMPAYAELSDIKQSMSPRELNVWKSRIPRYTKQYDELLKEIYKNPDIIKDKVPLLRSYYPLTQQYQPFSKEILDKIAAHAMVLDSTSDNEIINDALASYNGLIRKHLMNFDVASFALTMARLDGRFGDEFFYKKIRDTLIKTFNRDGMGTRSETAYNILSYGEETYVLEHIAKKIESSEIFEVRKKYYNVHEIINNDGNYKQIFMNVTQPIKNIFYNKAIEEQKNKTPLRPIQ